MAKKFIEFLEAAALIIITGVIVVGVYKYVDSKEEPKEETPIVEEAPGDEEPDGDETPEEPVILSFTVSHHDQEYTYNFEEGMTWEEFLASDYNTNGVFEIVSDPYVFYDGYGPTNSFVKTDLIVAGSTYVFG